MASVEALLQDVADSMTESPPDTLKEVLRRQEKARALLVEAVTSQQAAEAMLQTFIGSGTPAEAATDERTRTGERTTLEAVSALLRRSSGTLSLAHAEQQASSSVLQAQLAMLDSLAHISALSALWAGPGRTIGPDSVGLCGSGLAAQGYSNCLGGAASAIPSAFASTAPPPPQGAGAPRGSTASPSVPGFKPAGGVSDERPSGKRPPPSNRQQDRNRYKTCLCHAFAEAGACKWGEQCTYAHGIQELRVVGTEGATGTLHYSAEAGGFTANPWSKTVQCTAWKAEGRCRYGEQCEFAHGVHELRAKPKDLVSLPAGAGWSTYLHDGG